MEGRKRVRAGPVLGGAAFVLFLLAFVAAWTAPETAPGAPLLGMLLGAGVLAVAAIAVVAGWVDGTIGRPPEEQLERFGGASLALLVTAAGTAAIGFLALEGAPDSYLLYRREPAATDALLVLRRLLIAAGVVSLLAGAVAFLAAWALGRAALAEVGGTRLEGPGRVRAGFAPAIGAVALLLFLLLGPGIFAAALAEAEHLARSAGAGSEELLLLGVGLAVSAILLAGLWLLALFAPELLHGVFCPVEALFARGRTRRVLVAAEIVGALAALSISLSLSL